MIRTIGTGFALVAATAFAVGASSAGANEAQTGQAAKSITCTVKLSKQRDPSATQTGIDFAQITCSKPFGFGAQYDEFKLFPKGNPPSGTGFMNYKAYFDGGRVNGRWEVSFAATTKPCDFNFKVKSTWNGGTGKFKNVKGSGSGAGDFTDLKEAPACDNATVKYKMQVTGI